MRDHDRVIRSVRRWHRRHPDAWNGPTVREIAKSLRLTVKDVENEAAELPLMLESYSPDEPVGGWFVTLCE